MPVGRPGGVTERNFLVPGTRRQGGCVSRRARHPRLLSGLRRRRGLRDAGLDLERPRPPHEGQFPEGRPSKSRGRGGGGRRFTVQVRRRYSHPERLLGGGTRAGREAPRRQVRGTGGRGISGPEHEPRRGRTEDRPRTIRSPGCPRGRSPRRRVLRGRTAGEARREWRAGEVRGVGESPQVTRGSLQENAASEGRGC